MGTGKCPLTAALCHFFGSFIGCGANFIRKNKYSHRLWGQFYKENNINKHRKVFVNICQCIFEIDIQLRKILLASSN